MTAIPLYEQWGCPTDGLNKPLVETHSVDGALYIEGTFLQADVINKNKRLYPKKLWKKLLLNTLKNRLKLNRH